MISGMLVNFLLPQSYQLRFKNGHWLDSSSITLMWLVLHYLDFSYIRNVLTLGTNSIAWCPYQKDRSLHLETNSKISPHPLESAICSSCVTDECGGLHGWGTLYLFICTFKTLVHKPSLAHLWEGRHPRAQKLVIFRDWCVCIRSHLPSTVRD